MPISHKQCDHPATAAARKKCRESQGVEPTPRAARPKSQERVLAEKAGVVRKTRTQRQRPRRTSGRARRSKDVSDCFLINKEKHGQMARWFTHHTVPDTWLEDMPDNFSTAAKRFMAFGWAVTWWPPVQPSVVDQKLMQSITVDGPMAYITLEWNVADYEDRVIRVRPYGMTGVREIGTIKEAAALARTGI